MAVSIDILKFSLLFLCLNSITVFPNEKSAYLPSDIYVHLEGTCVESPNKFNAVFPEGAIVQLYFLAIALATS